MSEESLPDDTALRARVLEAKLGAAEAKFRRLVEQLPAVIYATEFRGPGKQNRSVYVSPQVEELLGFTQDEVMADPDFWSTRIHPDDRAEVLGAIRTSLELREPYSLESRAVHRDGRVLWVLAKGSVHREQGSSHGILDGLLFDITEAKDREAELRRSNEERSLATREAEAKAEQLATLNRITQAVTSQRELGPMLETLAREMVDLFSAKNGVIALVAEGARELRVVADFSHDAEAPNLTGHVFEVRGTRTESEVLDRGKPITAHRDETRTPALRELMTRRGAESLMICPLLSRGEVIGVIAIDTDRADRVYTAAELSLAETVAGQIAGAVENARLFAEEHRSREGAERDREAAEAGARAKSTFVASMSHELRTPLNAILGFVRVMERERDRSSEDLERLGIISRSGEHLLGLINDILSITKVETGMPSDGTPLGPSARGASSSERESVLTSERLASLPEESRARLMAALAIGDDEAASRVVDDVRGHDGPLAETLDAEIRECRFDRLLRLLEGIHRG